ncbi:MAG TPA: efflux RND transporter permease subunit [Polyangiaceae bacterium]|nr:efflux RND transporter permease subunit [Polyangiaceae bacterium]
MDPIKLFIRRPIFTAMLLLALVVFGLFSWPKMGVDMMPDMDIPVVTVVTVLPGADPETIEKDVTEPLEEVFNTLPGLHTLTSVNVENVSQIIIRFDMERDIDVAAQDIRDRVQSTLSKLPTDIQTPLIQKLDPGAMPILTLAFSGPLSAERMSNFAEDELKPALQQINGVGTVTIFGDQQSEVRITLDPTRLRAHGLTPLDAVGAVRAQDLDLSSGRTAESHVERIVKLKAEARSVEELRTLVLSSPMGIPVRLGEVADVTQGPAEPRSLARLGSSAAIGLTVTKQSGANTVQVVSNILAGIAGLQQRLPEGCELQVVHDDSKYIRSSITAVQEDMGIGGVLAVVVVLIFLRNWRSTLVSAVALPASVIGTFAFMHLLGFTFNIVTMLALTLSIGLLIDDAIVVIENVVRHLENGVPPMRAAAEGTRQIAIAVLAVTLSVVAMFLPVAFMSGIIGRVFVQFGVTVVVAVMISYAVSMTLTPMMSSRVLREEGRLDRWVWRLVERVISAMERVYRSVLGALLRHRAFTLLSAVALLAVSVFMATRLEFSFIPKQDMSSVKVSLELPPGSRLEETGRQLADIAAIIQKIPGVRSTFITAGGGVKEEVNKGDVLVTLEPIRERSYSQQDLQKYLRATLKAVPGTMISVVDGSSIAGGLGRPQDIQFELRGTDWEAVLAAATKVEAAMKANPMFVDVDMSYRAGKPQLDVLVDRERAASLGILAAPLGQSLRVLLGRDKVGDFRQGGRTSEIKVMLPDDVLADPLALGSVQVRTLMGTLVELRNVAKLVDGTSAGQIDHGAQVRQITMLANLQGASLSEGMRFLNEFATAEFPPTVKTGFTGMGGELGDAMKEFVMAIFMGVILLYIILAAQFESLIHPLSIMMALPLAVIGALGALFLVNQDMSLFAMIGMVMLLGLVAKNGILLIEFTNQLREKGHGVHEALLEAGPVRLRPILMTTVAMIAGMTPVALARGDGAETRVPMAIAIIGGLITSTFLTLGIVPVVYSVLDGVRARLGALWSRGKKAAKMPVVDASSAKVDEGA